MAISFTVNGREVVSNRPPATRLLDVLRDEMGLTGVKCGCGEGECGACSVLLGGRLVTSCLVPVGDAAGQQIVTIEGFRETERFQVLSAAFDACGAVQCGFCTPGMILAAEALLRRIPHPSDDQIACGLAGNFCRCTGYRMIIEAVRLASERGEGLWDENPAVDEVYPVETVEDALAIMRETGAEPVAGGTDWMLNRAADAPAVFIGRIPMLREVKETDVSVEIGACVTYNEIESNPRIPRILREAAASIAAPAIRNRGTIGGNIVNASPAGDMLPVLYMLDASVTLAGPDGTRKMPVASFITGVKETKLRRGEELLISVHVPKLVGFMRFDKVGARRAQAISKCSMAAAMRVAGERIMHFRAAFGAVGRTVLRVTEIEKELIGKTPEEARAMISKILDAYETVLSPIDDARSTAEYRKEICLNMLEAFLLDALQWV